MAANWFGTVFRMTTWGESHGEAIGVVLDGVPAGLALGPQDIQRELDLRRPGSSPYVTQRNEADQVQILSGLFEGRSTGAPISLIIKNEDKRSEDYEALRDVYRPGHASFTYWQKYGEYDHRGGGRASARETAARVAAGAVAKKILGQLKIETKCELVEERDGDWSIRLQRAMEAGDSLPGRVSFASTQLPIGLGDPVYEKLEANIAKAMLSIPASRAFRWGEATENESGKSFNGEFALSKNAKVFYQDQQGGGTLGGISHGGRIWGEVSFKPTSSIGLHQWTYNRGGERIALDYGEGKKRHDPCVAIRAVPVVEAMLRLCLVDALLMNMTCKMEYVRKIYS